MELGLILSPIITIIVGILILLFPKLLRFLIGAYLIVIGVIQLVF